MKICGRCDHNSDAYWRENNANNQDTVEKFKCDLVGFVKINFLPKKNQREENLAEFDLCLESN